MYYKTDMADLKFTENDDKLLYKMKSPDQETQELVDSLIKSTSRVVPETAEEGLSPSTPEDADGDSNS